jgi:hypothetical protein
MAKGIVESALTMNPIEVQDLSQFIIEKIFTRPELLRLHGIRTGVKMKEQIVFASQFGKTGIKGTATCTRKTSGAASTLTQKYWEPEGIEDTLIHCNAEIDALFKAYFTKINKYRDKYEIEGTDLEIFFSILLLESIQRTLWRAAWFADKSVAVATTGVAGLKLAGDVKFYDYFEGLWEQIFAAVTATTVKRYTIIENAEVTTAAQLTLAAGRSIEIFEGIWALADPRLKSDPDRIMEVTNEIWENYRRYLQSKGENFTIEFTTEGLKELNWNGVPIVNMETVWDLDLQADFVDNTTNNAYYLPNRVVLTVPENKPIGTLNESDFDELEIFYDQKERQFYMGYGFSLDAKLLEEYRIVVAY